MIEEIYWNSWRGRILTIVLPATIFPLPYDVIRRAIRPVTTPCNYPGTADTPDDEAYAQQAAAVHGDRHSVPN